MGIEAFLGSAINLYKIETENEREIQKIISTDNDKKREREIQELSTKLNHQLKEDELQFLCQRYKDMHNQKVLEEQNRHDEAKTKLYNDYDRDIRQNELNSKTQLAKINQENLKNIIDHEENTEKIHKEAQNDYYLFKKEMEQNSKKFELEKDEIGKKYDILKQDKENEKLDILKKYENEKSKMDYDYKTSTENTNKLLEFNKNINEKNYNLEMEKLSIERATKLKQLEIIEQLLKNPNMQNPMMLQMLMGQITPKPLVDQGNGSPGPLPNKNMNDFNQLTFTKMTPQM